MHGLSLTGRLWRIRSDFRGERQLRIWGAPVRLSYTGTIIEALGPKHSRAVASSRYMTQGFGSNAPGLATGIKPLGSSGPTGAISKGEPYKGRINLRLETMGLRTGEH